MLAVFWACLIAASNLQMYIPQFIILAEGKFSIASLLGLVTEPFTIPLCLYYQYFHEKSTLLEKSYLPNVLVEQRAYPSRSTFRSQRYLLVPPTNETTFIVGLSFSGRSSIAQLLMKIYDLQDGVVTLHERDMSFLDEEWMKGHVAGVGQQGASEVVSLDGKTMFATGSRLEEGKVRRESVEEACRAALMHEFTTWI